MRPNNDESAEHKKEFDPRITENKGYGEKSHPKVLAARYCPSQMVQDH